jgi:hypothetical protein
MNGDRQHAFVATAVFITGALLAWLGAFVIVYVFAALACARNFAGATILNVPIVPAVTTLTCVLTATVTVILLRRGAAALRARAVDEHERFIGFVAFATSGLALFALILLALPPLLINACARI